MLKLIPNFVRLLRLMAILKVVHFPDDRLRVKCRPVEVIDDKIKTLAADMFETMYDDEGIGLAAPQVGLDIRMVVIDIPDDDGKQGKPENQVVLINPEIISREGEVLSAEGCLSVPEYTAEIPRAEKVQVKALDLNGDEIIYNADGLFAICMQHELEHLDGTLFIDHLSALKRGMLLKKYSKLKKEAQRNGVEY